MVTDESTPVSESYDEIRTETDTAEGRRSFLKKAAATGIVGMMGTAVSTGAASATEPPKSAERSTSSDSLSSEDAVTADYGRDTRVSPTDHLNIRSQPGLGGNVAVTMPPHATGTVLSSSLVMDGYTWQVVGWDGNYYIGWCATEYLSYVGDAPHDGYGAMVNAVANLNTRAKPGLDGEIVTTAPNGSDGWAYYPRLEIDGYDWRPVKWNDSNYVGWCAEDYLAIIA